MWGTPGRPRSAARATVTVDAGAGGGGTAGREAGLAHATRPGARARARDLEAQ